MKRLILVSLILSASIAAQNSVAVSQQLQEAVSQGHHLGSEANGADAVRAALDQGLDVNAQDAHGWTALHSAAFEGLPSVVKLLLERGADPRLTTIDGETPLLLAAGNFIVKKKAELVPERGFGPEMATYQLAAPGRIVEMLLASGADPNVADAAGKTPLMAASMQGWSSVVMQLLDEGADVDASDAEGRSTMDYLATDDANTRAVLAQAGAPAGSGRSGRVACDIQIRLAAEGFYTAPIDCLLGTGSREGLKRFQASAGLEETGEPDAETLAALGVER